MLRILTQALGPRGHDGVLGFYGDHLPSLPHAFAHFGFDEWASDYVLLDGAAPRVQRRDLAADLLPWMILDRLRRRGAVEARRAAVVGAA